MDNRRSQVPFDAHAFEKQARAGQALPIGETFERIHRENHWASGSRSGAGSSEEQTRSLRDSLRVLVVELGIQSLLDAPCGDFGWMKDAALPLGSYVGLDIVGDLVSRNQRLYGDGRHRFALADLTRDALPASDLLLCRDCLVHFSFADIERALDNIRSSSITYLLTTTFSGCQENEEIVTGDWRPLNLEEAPFHLPPPTRLVCEGCTEGGGLFHDKSLGLWLVRDLRR